MKSDPNFLNTHYITFKKDYKKMAIHIFKTTELKISTIYA